MIQKPVGEAYELRLLRAHRGRRGTLSALLATIAGRRICLTSRAARASFATAPECRGSAGRRPVALPAAQEEEGRWRRHGRGGRTTMATASCWSAERSWCLQVRSAKARYSAPRARSMWLRARACTCQHRCGAYTRAESWEAGGRTPYWLTVPSRSRTRILVGGVEDWRRAEATWLPALGAVFMGRPCQVERCSSHLLGWGHVNFRECGCADSCVEA